jgi:hypothetical protein
MLLDIHRMAKMLNNYMQKNSIKKSPNCSADTHENLKMRYNFT